MVSYQLFLSYLLFLDPVMNVKVDYVTQHCTAFKCGAFDNDCNRVYHDQTPTDEEVREINSFFADVPYSWLVQVEDNVTRQVLEKNGLLRIPQSLPASPLMILDLDNFDGYVNQLDDFIVCEIDGNDSRGMMQWIHDNASVSHAPVIDFVKFMMPLQDRYGSNMRLYVGYYQQEPVATTMTIMHHNVVSIHHVITAPACRRKGFASVIVRKALCDAKNDACTQAVLLASASGKPVYERIGFKECASYVVYGNYSSTNFVVSMSALERVAES